MRKYLLLLALVFLVVPVSCTNYEFSMVVSQDDMDGVRLEELVAMPTVQIQAEGGLGSGVVFGDGTFILTAAHVVSHLELLLDNDGNPQRSPDGSLVFGPLVVEKCAIFKPFDLVPYLADTKVIKIDPELDLAVLKLEKAYPYGKAKFATSLPYLYQKCWISGHPLGVPHTTITEGRVQALWEEGFIRYSALSTFGNSGGPVWYQSKGEFLVFSICQRVFVNRDAVTHMGLGVLPGKMLDFVREYN